MPKRSYHDDDRRILQFAGQASSALVQGSEIRLSVTGYNFDGHRRAEGALMISKEMLSGSTQRSLEVSVPDDPKKGNFVFYFTISSLN